MTKGGSGGWRLHQKKKNRKKKKKAARAGGELSWSGREPPARPTRQLQRAAGGGATRPRQPAIRRGWRGGCAQAEPPASRQPAGSQGAPLDDSYQALVDMVAG